MNEQFNYFKEVCTEELVSSILCESSKKMSVLETVFEGSLRDIFKTKMTSELFSKIVECVAAEEFSKSIGGTVRNPTTDNDPDLFFEDRGYPLEVKITAGETFIGGEFSKRASPHLLLAWDANTASNFFLALAFLEKEDWKSGGENFYGTSLNKKKINELVEQGRAKVLFGSLEEMMKKNGEPRAKRAFKMTKQELK